MRFREKLLGACHSAVPGATLNVEFWRQRIRQAAADGYRDPVRGGVARQSETEYAADVERTQRLLHVWLPKESRVLEIGCGCGDLRVWLPEPTRYHGIDLVPEFIEEARRCYGTLPNTSYSVGDLSELSVLAAFGDDEFDVVIGRWVEGTVFFAMPEALQMHIRAECLRVAKRNLWFSPKHIEPAVWERGSDGEPVLTHEPREM